MKTFAFALLGAMIAGAGSAHATVMTGTFAGQLATGLNVDYTGVFGFAPGTDITGQPFSATFTFDTAKLDDGSGNPPTDTGFVNGPGELSVALTINGVTHTFLSDKNSFVEINPPGHDFIINLSSYGDTDDSLAIDIPASNPGFFSADSLVQTFSYAGPFDSITGSFYIAPNNNGGPNEQATGNFDFGGGGSLSLHPVTTSDVPEPASIAALLSGLGGLSMLRRRRLARPAEAASQQRAP